MPAESKYSSLRTCSNGFRISDVEWLVRQLNKLGFKVKRQPSNNSIGISVHSVKDFLDYIGKCITECYEYKWAYKKREGNKLCLSLT